MWFKPSVSALWLAAMAWGTAKADDGEIKSIAVRLGSLRPSNRAAQRSFRAFGFGEHTTGD